MVNLKKKIQATPSKPASFFKEVTSGLSVEKAPVPKISNAVGELPPSQRTLPRMNPSAAFDQAIAIQPSSGIPRRHCSSYIQTDDAGCQICHQEQQKPGEFSSLLHRSFRAYTLTEDALDYLRALKYPQKWLRILHQ